MVRYKDLYRAAELTADYERLVAWQALSRTAKQTLYKQHLKGTARMNLKRTTGYIRIFGAASGLVVIKKLIPTSISQPDADALSLVIALINIATPERAAIVPPGDTGINILSDIKKFKFAKLSLISVIGQSATTGRVLGAGYTRNNTDTVSTAFGRGTASETYTQAVAAIKASSYYTQFLAIPPPSGVLASNRIVIYPEAGTA